MMGQLPDEPQRLWLCTTYSGALVLGTDTGSLTNHVPSRATEVTPVVGLGATVLQWTDRHAGTIIEVNPDTFIWQRDKAVRTDANGASDDQSYAYTPDPDGTQIVFKRAVRGKNMGQWRQNGRANGTTVTIGVRNEYYDYSF